MNTLCHRRCRCRLKNDLFINNRLRCTGFCWHGLKLNHVHCRGLCWLSNRFCNCSATEHRYRLITCQSMCCGSQLIDIITLTLLLRRVLCNQFGEEFDNSRDHLKHRLSHRKIAFDHSIQHILNRPRQLAGH